MVFYEANLAHEFLQEQGGKQQKDDSVREIMALRTNEVAVDVVDDTCERACRCCMNVYIAFGIICFIGMSALCLILILWHAINPEHTNDDMIFKNFTRTHRMYSKFT